MSEFDLDVFDAFEEAQEPAQTKKAKLSHDLDYPITNGNYDNSETQVNYALEQAEL